MDIQTKLHIGIEEIEGVIRERYGIGLNSEFEYDIVNTNEPMAVGQKHLNSIRINIWGEYVPPKNMPRANPMADCDAVPAYETATTKRGF